MSTMTERVATTTLGAPRRAQRALAAALSTVLHAVVILALTATSVHMITPERTLIPLVIRAPPPPPPPPGPGSTGGTSAVVPPPVQPAAPVEQPKRKPVPPKVIPEKKKIAAKRPPSPKAKEPSPVAEPPPAVAAPEGSAPELRAGGGVAGGVVGGNVGGKVGGRVGGTGDDVYTVDQVAVPPKLLQSVVPDYPVVARARGLQGVVVLQGIIDRTGAVESENVTVLQSQATFDEAAIKAFRKWRFSPGRNDSGEAVRVIVRQPIRFQLR